MFPKAERLNDRFFWLWSGDGIYGRHSSDNPNNHQGLLTATGESYLYREILKYKGEKWINHN